MGLENFLSKTDLLLYKKILKTIIKNWDTLDPDTLSDFLEKLGELHNNLSNVVNQMKTYSMYRPVKDIYNESKTKENISLVEVLKTIKNQKITIRNENNRKKNK